MSAARHIDNEDHGAHPSQSGSDRWPADQLLRRHGYAIFARPEGAPARWLGQDGRVYDEADAVAACRAAGEKV